ncbi:MAG: acyl-CoA thioesterase domain-containing protein [Aquihabitans sp.]
MRQEQASRAAIATVATFLGGPTEQGDGWDFEFGEHLESNWGAVYGGALSAGMLSVARCALPERSPRAMHVQIVRSVPRGSARATAEVRHAGRTVATVEVQLYDARDKLAAIALLTMVTPDAVATQYHDTTATPFDVTTVPFTPVRAPVQEPLKMLREVDGVFYRAYDDTMRRCVDGTAPPIGTLTVPWERLDVTGPEVACLAADAIVAAPVLYSFIPADALGPNADLSLRFTTAPAMRVVQAAGTLMSVQHGTATIGIEVQTDDHLLAHALATSLLPLR